MSDPASTDPDTWDGKEYSVYELLAAGSRFTDDYDEETAVQHYLRLHPESTEAQVRADLKAETAKHGG